MSAVAPNVRLVELGWSAVVARRMERQGLSSSLPDIESAVSAMGGAHAQVMSAAELSIGIRVADSTPAAVRSALGAGGQLVKTYGPRGTVHLLPRTELPLWCAALGAVPVRSSLPASVKLDSAQNSAILGAIAESLAGSGPLDGDELDAAVVARLGAWAAEPVVPAFGGWWPRWRQAISPAAYAGVLAFGDNRGSRVTYLNPGIAVDLDPDRALRWLLRRYLGTYGPATPEHYGRWLGVRKTWAAQQFAEYADELQDVTVDGAGASALKDETTPSSTTLSSVHLLPHFDPYVIGSFPREKLFPGAVAARALGRGQAGVHPVLLVDGIVAGVWGSARTSSTLTVTVEPVGSLSKSTHAAVELAAQRIAEFQGLDATVLLGTVSAGAHK